jgi:predicted permease
MRTLRQTLRSFRTAPGVVALTVLVMAVGIGATVAIFSVVNQALIRPLPYREPERLGMIWERIPEIVEGNISASAPDYFDFRDRNRTFESLAAFEPREVNLALGNEASRVSAVRVTDTLFPLLGVEPFLGRGFTPEEDRDGGPRVAILSHALWQGRFGSDRALLGKTLLVDHVPHTVIGVMPPDFDFPPSMTRGFRPGDVFVPMALSARELEARGDRFDTSLLARLRPGVTLEEASADADRVASLIFDDYFEDSRGRFTLRGAATSLREEVVGGIRPALLILQGAASLLLLIACANAASLLLVRAASRRREIGMRSALGASRAGVFRMLLSESLFLSLAAGALGILFALWGVDALLSAVPESLARVDARVLDPRTLAFALLISTATGVAFGIAPAIALSRVTLANEIKPGSSQRRRRLGATFVVAEVAMALVLLASAALLLRSFQQVMKLDPGFAAEGRTAFTLSLPESKYSSIEVRSFFTTLLERLRGTPGVTAVAAGSNLPLDDAGRILIAIEGREEEAWGQNLCWPSIIEGEYFQALGIPLLRGRLFGVEDREDARPVVIVNEALARKYWPGEDALGRRFKWGSPTSKAPYMEIVGVVADSVQGKLNEPPLPAVYIPSRQIATGGASNISRTMTVVLKGETGDALAPAIRREVRALDPELPVYALRGLRDALVASESERRFLAFLVAIFALTAALLAAAGLVGVIGRTVTLSKREIGIRMALGAQASTVVGRIVLEGMKLAVSGLLLGIAASLLVTEALSSQLYAVSPRDPAVLSLVAALVIVLSSLAAYFPARRAARIDPIDTLRSE